MDSVCLQMYDCIAMGTGISILFGGSEFGITKL